MGRTGTVRLRAGRVGVVPDLLTLSEADGRRMPWGRGPRDQQRRGGAQTERRPTFGVGPLVDACLEVVRTIAADPAFYSPT